MEFGWIIVIGILATLAFVGKCGELYYNSVPRQQKPQTNNKINLLTYQGV